MLEPANRRGAGYSEGVKFVSGNSQEGTRSDRHRRRNKAPRFGRLQAGDQGDRRKGEFQAYTKFEVAAAVS